MVNATSKVATPLAVIADDDESDTIDELEAFYGSQTKKAAARPMTQPRAQRIEYKYAFGMKIPKNHDWVVKQRTGDEEAEVERRRAGLNSRPEIAYDHNGRRTKKSAEPGAGGADAILAPDIAEFRSKTRSNDRKKSTSGIRRKKTRVMTAAGAKKQSSALPMDTEGMLKFLRDNGVSSSVVQADLSGPALVTSSGQTMAEKPKPTIRVRQERSRQKAETLPSERNRSEDSRPPTKSEKMPLKMSQFQMPMQMGPPQRPISSAMTSSKLPIDGRQGSTKTSYHGDQENRENTPFDSYQRRIVPAGSGKSSLGNSQRKSAAKKAGTDTQAGRRMYLGGEFPAMQKLHFANPLTGTNADLRQSCSNKSLIESGGGQPFMDRTNAAANLRSSWHDNG